MTAGRQGRGLPYVPDPVAAPLVLIETPHRAATSHGGEHFGVRPRHRRTVHRRRWGSDHGEGIRAGPGQAGHHRCRRSRRGGAADDVAAPGTPVAGDRRARPDRDGEPGRHRPQPSRGQGRRSGRGHLALARPSLSHHSFVCRPCRGRRAARYEANLSATGRGQLWPALAATRLSWSGCPAVRSARPQSRRGAAADRSRRRQSRNWACRTAPNWPRPA